VKEKGERLKELQTVVPTKQADLKDRQSRAQTVVQQMEEVTKLSGVTSRCGETGRCCAFDLGEKSKTKPFLSLHKILSVSFLSILKYQKDVTGIFVFIHMVSDRLDRTYWYFTIFCLIREILKLMLSHV